VSYRGFNVGDKVQYESKCTREKFFYGQIVGFYGNGAVALCTDQTGLSARPVSIDRLQRPAPTYRNAGRAC
jgi:hypothetical protein